MKTLWMKWLVLIPAILVLIACSGGGSSPSYSGTSATLKSITVTPTSPSVAAGLTLQLKATGTYSDGTSTDITNSVAWSSDSGNATVAPSTGVVKGVTAGTTANITATKGGISGNVTLTINNAVLQSMTVMSVTTTVPVGLTDQFTAMGTFSDGSTLNITNSVSWTSDGTIASIDATGLATGVSIGGPIQITAALNGVSASAPLTVSNAVLTQIKITPSAPSDLTVGTTETFQAWGIYSDSSTAINITSAVTWSVDSTYASVVSSTDQGAVVQGSMAGQTPLTASYQGQTDSINLNVIAPVLQSIAITCPLCTPATSLTVPAGLQIQLLATGTYNNGQTQDLTKTVTWSVPVPASGLSPNAIVTSGPTDGGLVTGEVQGSTTVTATLNGASLTAPLTVTSPILESIVITPASASVAAGLTTNFAATGTYSDQSTANITNSVTWHSDNLNIATVVSGGVATGKALGSANITAVQGTVISNAAILTVTPAVLESVTISPHLSTVINLYVGQTQQFTATANYSDGTNADVTANATFNSSTAGIVNFTNPGVALASKVGSTVITACYNSICSNANGTGTFQSLSVGPAQLISLTIDPRAATIYEGTTQQFNAIGNYTDGPHYNEPVTWTTSDSTIATISTSGVATAAIVANFATVTITAKDANNAAVTATASLSVSFTHPHASYWTGQASNTTATLNAVATNGSSYVAVGGSGTILFSTDGITWNQDTSGTGNTLYGIAWSGTQWVAVGASNTLLTSSNGMAWSPVTLAMPAGVTSMTLRNISRVNGNLTAVGNQNNSAGVIVYSTDYGNSWTVALTTLTPLSAVDENALAAVSDDGHVYVNQSGGPGGTWVSAGDLATQLNSVAGGMLLDGTTFDTAVGSAGVVLRSTDNATWNVVSNFATGLSTTTGLNYVTWATPNSQLVIAGSDGSIWTNTPAYGDYWSKQVSGTTASLHGIVCNTTQCVAVGDSGAIVVSQ